MGSVSINSDFFPSKSTLFMRKLIFQNYLPIWWFWNALSEHVEPINGSELAKFQFHPPSRCVHRVNYVRIEEPVDAQAGRGRETRRISFCLL